jgi:hypothetical protein
MSTITIDNNDFLNAPHVTASCWDKRRTDTAPSHGPSYPLQCITAPLCSLSKNYWLCYVYCSLGWDYVNSAVYLVSFGLIFSSSLHKTMVYVFSIFNDLESLWLTFWYSNCFWNSVIVHIIISYFSYSEQFETDVLYYIVLIFTQSMSLGTSRNIEWDTSTFSLCLWW